MLKNKSFVDGISTFFFLTLLLIIFPFFIQNAFLQRILSFLVLMIWIAALGSYDYFYDKPTFKKQLSFYIFIFIVIVIMFWGPIIL